MQAIRVVSLMLMNCSDVSASVLCHHQGGTVILCTFIVFVSVKLLIFVFDTPLKMAEMCHKIGDI
jgi:hypothetical protein